MRPFVAFVKRLASSPVGSHPALYHPTLYPFNEAMAASQNTLLASRSSSASATGRRLLSRIASPFSPKPRSLTEYYIRPDEPHRQYAPGDTLKGAVVVTVVKPIRITHLVVSLRGHVRVFKHGSTESAYLSDSFSTSGQGKRAGEYYGNGFASLFQDEVVLCGEGRLESGVYEFKFELDFPEKGLPSSIDVRSLHSPMDPSDRTLERRYGVDIYLFDPVRARDHLVYRHIDLDASDYHITYHLMRPQGSPRGGRRHWSSHAAKVTDHHTRAHSSIAQSKGEVQGEQTPRASTTESKTRVELQLGPSKYRRRGEGCSESEEFGRRRRRGAR